MAVRERTDAAEARRRAAQFAGFDPPYEGVLNIVVTEVSTNLIKHAGGGDLIVHRTGTGPGSAVDVIAIDHGPGMPDAERSFKDGYSTAGSPGTGLGAIARAASFCDIYSGPEKGLALVARVGPANADGKGEMEVGAVCAPYPGERISGDCWAIEGDGSRYRLALADGLGHGLLAAEASDAGVESVIKARGMEPADAIDAAHGRLRSTRGAALSVADVNLALGVSSYAGVGNVSACIVQNGNLRRQMVNANGTLGHEMRAARQYQYPVPPEALVIMHSDGVSANWSFDKYPGLFWRDPALIAAVLFRDYRRTRDDATIIVVRANGGRG